MEILNNLQKPEYGDMDITMDMTNSLSCILNVQLYLTLEKAKENVCFICFYMLLDDIGSNKPVEEIKFVPDS